MKIIVNTKKILDAIATVSAYAGTNKALPIFDCVKIQTKGNTIKLQTSNQDKTIRKYITAIEIDTDSISLCVDCKTFLNMLRSIKDEVVTLNVGESVLTIEYGTGKLTLPITDANEFVDVATEEYEHEFSLPSQYIIEAIQTGLPFVSTDTIRPQLRCIYCNLKDGKFVYCATDTKSLVCDEIEIGHELPECSWLIDTAQSNVLIGMLKDNVDVTVKVGQKNVQYRTKDCIIINLLQTQGYPDFRRVLPRENNIDAVINKEETISMVDRLLTAKTSDSHILKLSFDMLGLAAKLENIDYNRSGEERISCSCPCEMAIGVNPNIMLKGLKSMTERNVTLKLKDPQRPMLIQGDTNKKVLIMPMQL